MKYPILIEVNTLLIAIAAMMAISFLAGEDNALDDRASRADRARIMAMGK